MENSSPPSDRKYKRTSVRAPLTSFLLFESGHIFGKARLVNISEGGFLIEAISPFPVVEVFSFLIDIPFFPTLQKLELDDLKNYTPQNVKRLILGGKAKVIRMIEPKGHQSENIKVAAQFEQEQEKLITAISSYVRLTTVNLVYLLRLLEMTTGREERIFRLREVARILGYPFQEKISLLHQKVAHDYQSLKWL